MNRSSMKSELTPFDEFKTSELDPNKWTTAKLPLGNGNVWEYFDPNTKIKTGDGSCEISVNPFTRFNDSIQIADNPKTLFSSAAPLPVRDNQVLTVSARVGATAHNARLEDLYDAFITFNLFDFESAVVLDFLLNGRLVIALFERLFIPGMTDETNAYAKEAQLPVVSEPGRLHHCLMTYDRGADLAEWSLDGELVYRFPRIPVKVNQFGLGMGLMTLKPIAAPWPYYFPKSTSLHGQGITGIWTDIRWGVSEGRQ